MLKVSGLTKTFGLLTAVDDLSFDVREGEIFGFLGPNGAGKTTTIHMICGLVHPDAGTIELDGRDVHRAGAGVRRKLGVVPQDVALYEELNAVENLNFWGALYGMKKAALKSRVEELLTMTGLADRAKDRVKTYSGGMKRRLNMAAGLIHHPRLLLLDEPTVGIDPQARHNMLQTIRNIAESGTTILYTTHYMDEAEALCDRLAILDHGRILAMGTQDEIQKIVGENRILRVTGTFEKTAAESLPDTLTDLSLISISENEVVYSLPVRHGTGQFIETLIRSGFGIDNLAIREPNLDSVFIKLTGRELRD
ncbi:MAG TPA: ABC transporter ATP-binding protein [bacterium]|nr:ABC transporter ATP-binding protein [bacterium]